MDPSRFVFGPLPFQHSASLAGSITFAAHSYVGETHVDPGYHDPLPDHNDPIGLLLGGVALGVLGSKAVKRVRER